MCVCRMPSGCLEGVLKVSRRCLEVVLTFDCDETEVEGPFFQTNFLFLNSCAAMRYRFKYLLCN